MVNILNELRQLTDLLNKGKIKIFCGAGISYNSGVPLAGLLTNKILEAFGASLDEIKIFSNSKYPFEAFMGDIGYSHEGEMEGNVVKELNKLFKIGSPNNNHYFIANLYRLGLLDKVLTTNFDCHIENALQLSGITFKLIKEEQDYKGILWDESDNTLIKIHGSISHPDSIRTTINGVSNHFLNNEREKVLRKIFVEGSH